jgi:hypothetical protein
MLTEVKEHLGCFGQEVEPLKPAPQPILVQLRTLPPPRRRRTSPGMSALIKLISSFH